MQFVSKLPVPTGSLDETAGSMELLTRNSLTTAGAAIAAGTAVSGAALLLAAVPAQLATACAVAGGLYYAGDRKAKGLPLNPMQKDEPFVQDGKIVTAGDVAVDATPEVQAAA